MTAPTLHHARQAGPSGCLWHATYALTGEDWLLAMADLADNPLYWRVVLYEAGALVVPLYREPLPRPEFAWEHIRANMTSDQAALLVTLDTRPLHMIAVLYPKDPHGVVLVSDSQRDGVKGYDGELFHAVYGSRALGIDMLASANPDAHPLRAEP